MGRIDDALQMFQSITPGTERALQVAGLISTLFKIKGVMLVVTGQLAFDTYTDTISENTGVELAALGAKLPPRTVLEVMRGQLHAAGSLYHWNVAGVTVRFHETALIPSHLCRDLMADHGMVKLQPVEEIAADCILSAVYPEPDPEAQARAHLLLVNGLAEAFQMDWTALYTLCHQPEYRVGEELAQMRLAAKREVDATGRGRDHIGETSVLPSLAGLTGETTPAAAPESMDATTVESE